jgi:hypothetical protein
MVLKGYPMNRITITSETTGASRDFERICACIVWGDVASENPESTLDALVMAGEEPGGRIIVMREYQESHSDIMRRVVNTKDRWQCYTIFASGDPPSHLRDLYRLDGLTYYHFSYRSAGKPVYSVADPEKKWPWFRGHNHVASIVPLYDSMCRNFNGAYERARQMSEQRRIAIDHSECRRIMKTTQLAPSMAKENSVFLAYVYLVAMMAATTNSVAPTVQAQQPPEFWDYYRER